MGRIPCVLRCMLVHCSMIWQMCSCVVDRTSLEQPITSIELFKVSWNKMTCCWLTPFMAHFWATTTNEPIIVLISVFVFSLDLCLRLFLGLCLDLCLCLCLCLYLGLGLCRCLVLGICIGPYHCQSYLHGTLLGNHCNQSHQVDHKQQNSRWKIILELLLFWIQIFRSQNTFHVKAQVSPM